MRFLRKKLIRRTIGVLTSVVAFGMLQTTVYAGNTDRITKIKAGLASVLDAPVDSSQGNSTSAASDDEESSPDDDDDDASYSLVIAKVSDSVNVRVEPDENSEKAGKLYADCAGEILERGDGWTKIESGKLVGWVRNDFLYFGKKAQEISEDVGNRIATITGTTLRVREATNEDSSVLGLLAKGEQVIAFETDDDGWLRIEFEGDDGYISAEYADVEFTLDTGETMEQIHQREAEEKAQKEAAEKAEKKKKEESNKNSSSSEKKGNQTTTTTVENKGAVAADVSDAMLLAGLIQAEAGRESYEGMVAVGSVVMNRVRSGAYPNSISGVIYASGQFPPATNGTVAKKIQAGVSANCIKAAQAVLAGTSNIGNATHFRRNDGRDGIVIGNHVFW